MSDEKSKDKYLKECQDFQRMVFTVIGASSVRVVLICGRMTQAAMSRHSTWPGVHLHLERHTVPA